MPGEMPREVYSLLSGNGGDGPTCTGGGVGTRAYIRTKSSPGIEAHSFNGTGNIGYCLGELGSFLFRW
jgi:hypothetical protein